MLPNKNYRFIYVSSTLREGKRGVSVSYVPSEVNKSNDKSTYQFWGTSGIVEMIIFAYR